MTVSTDQKTACCIIYNNFTTVDVHMAYASKLNERSVTSVGSADTYDAQPTEVCSGLPPVGLVMENAV